MAIVIAALDVTQDYEDGKILTEQQLKDALDETGGSSCESYINTKVVNNLLQLTRDAYPDGVFDFTDDGVKSTWNANGTLFDKQNQTTKYNGGDITIGTSADVDWVDVDTINASADFTPDAVGHYKVTCQFTHKYTFTATTLGQLFSRFRLTDGSDASAIQASGCLLPAPGGGSCEVENLVTLMYILNWTVAGDKNVKLQKRNDTTTDVATNIVAASEANGEIVILIEKI